MVPFRAVKHPQNSISSMKRCVHPGNRLNPVHMRRVFAWPALKLQVSMNLPDCLLKPLDRKDECSRILTCAVKGGGIERDLEKESKKKRAKPLTKAREMR